MSTGHPPELDRLHVSGSVWSADGSTRTELGRLLARAKDHGDRSATTVLGDRVAAHLAEIGTEAPRDAVVAPVPPNPGSAVDVPGALAIAVARSLGVDVEPGLLVRRNPTARLRDTAPSERLPLVVAAGYEVTRPIGGGTVVLVDDVILTGTTLAHLAGLVIDAGVTSVWAVVAARSRRAAGR